MDDTQKRGRIRFDTPLYKFEVMLFRPERVGVVFARDTAEADDIAAAINGEPQDPMLMRPGRLIRTMHHPRLRGGLYEFTYGERLAEARLRQRNRGRAMSERASVYEAGPNERPWLGSRGQAT